MLHLFAATDIPPNAFVAVLVFGVVVGVIGHIVSSRTLIVTGILVIALVSSYFWITFLLQPAH